MDYKNKKVLVIGMAKSGVSSAALLCRLGADVTIYDVKKKICRKTCSMSWMGFPIVICWGRTRWIKFRKWISLF